MVALAENHLFRTGSGQPEPGKVLALILPLFLFLPTGLHAMSRTIPVQTSHPLVSSVAGDVTVKGRGQSTWEPVERGTLLLSGDVIRTNFNGRANISFESGTMELCEGTEIRIPTTGTNERKKDIRDLEVREGRVFLAIAMAGEEGSFRFSTGNTRGEVTGSMLSVSFLGEGTAVNVYRGEAQVSHGERTSSLVPGSSLSIQEGEPLGSISRFDPGPAVKNYRRKVSPGLNVTSGLPDMDERESNPDEREQVWASMDGDDNPRKDPTGDTYNTASRDEEPSDTVSGIEGNGISITSLGDSASGIEEEGILVKEPEMGIVGDEAVLSVDGVISGQEVHQ